MFDSEKREDSYGYARDVMVDTIPQPNPDYVPTRMGREVFIYSLERKKGYSVIILGDLTIKDSNVSFIANPFAFEVVEKPSFSEETHLDKALTNSPSFQISSSTFVLTESEFAKCEDAIKKGKDTDSDYIRLDFSVERNKEKNPENNVLPRDIYTDNSSTDNSRSAAVEAMFSENEIPDKIPYSGDLSDNTNPYKK